MRRLTGLVLGRLSCPSGFEVPDYAYDNLREHECAAHSDQHCDRNTVVRRRADRNRKQSNDKTRQGQPAPSNVMR